MSFEIVTVRFFQRELSVEGKHEKRIQNTAINRINYQVLLLIEMFIFVISIFDISYNVYPRLRFSKGKEDIFLTLS